MGSDADAFSDQMSSSLVVTFQSRELTIGAYLSPGEYSVLIEVPFVAAYIMELLAYTYSNKGNENYRGI